MILQLGALFLLGSLSASFALPPCVCNRNLKPVCGSDGQTYGNECMLQCAQLSDPQLFTARSGRCDGTSLGPPRDIRQTRDCTLCTLEYTPICGTDGMTYPNRCTLECTPGPVQLAYHGPCRNRRETDQSCSCPDELSTVCGTDGSNYGNPCHLNCSKNKHESLEILHVGPCSSSDSIATHECVGCTLKVRPVCGTDGKTYRNPCMLNCEREKDENLHIDYEGPCDPRLQFVESSACGCAPKVQPVCGTNANTYRNKCLLYCAKEKKESIHLDYEGFCKVNQAESFPCTCTRNHKPVCASNGVTFSNECLMKCAGAHLTVAKQAPCEG